MKFPKVVPSRYFLEFFFTRLLAAVINIFPIGVSTWFARRLGDVIFLILPGRRRIALENVTIAFGNSKTNSEKQCIIRESFRHLVTCFMEYFRLPKRVEEIYAHVQFMGTEHLDRAFERGNGAIFVMAHLGPWEYLAFIAHLFPTTVLGRPIRNPYFDRWVQTLRQAFNLEHSDKTKGARMILTKLKKNQLVAIVIDQWAGNEGLWMPFFNVPTSTTSLPARLASKTGAALVPAYCIRSASGRYEIHIEPEVALEDHSGSREQQIRAITEKLNRRLEEQIGTYPGQWIWTHKRWKEKGPMHGAKDS